MEGGPGNDVFAYAGGRFSGGEINDFTEDEDRIELTSLNVPEGQLEQLLRNTTGHELDLSRLGAGFEHLGTITLNVEVATLDTSGFILG